MIIVKLSGGLGNQLFQYAFGRYLAHLHQTELKLDTTAFDNQSDKYTYRQYALADFNIKATIAQSSDIEQVAPNLLWKQLKNKVGISTNGYYKEPHFHFDSGALQLPNNMYIEGYWQSEKYFFPIADLVRQEITFKRTLAADAQLISTNIQKNNAVSLHIRRGDYTKKATANLYLSPCPLEYYQKVIAYLTSHITEPTFYIFSDDIAWVKSNFRLAYPIHFVENTTPAEDLILMSQCRHHIIANSTFSWWGAWLNSNPNKIVVAPQKWFETSKFDTKDLLPKGWVRL